MVKIKLKSFSNKTFHFYLIFILFICCKNANRNEDYYDTVVTPVIKKEIQAIDTENINIMKKNQNVMDTTDEILLDSIKKYCKVFDELFDIPAILKSVSHFENGIKLIDLGFDNAEKIPQAKGDPYLDLIIINKKNSVKYFYISSIEKDDFSLLKTQGNFVIFTKYDSTVGNTKIYGYSPMKDHLYITSNLSEAEAEFNEIAFSDTSVLLDSKQYKWSIAKLEMCH